MAVAKAIEKIRRNFLWGDSSTKKTIHLVKWEKVTKSKKYGELGIKRLMEHNQALLAKWWWRFNKEKQNLWVLVVSGKYGLSEKCPLPRLKPNQKASVIWKDICEVGNQACSLNEVIQGGFRIQMCSYFWKMNGWRILFLKKLFLDYTTFLPRRMLQFGMSVELEKESCGICNLEDYYPALRFSRP